MIEQTPLSEKMGVVLTGTRADVDQLNRGAITRMLADHGAVLLRGFDLTVGEFEELSQEVSPEFLVHHDVARMYVNEDGTTQTVVPGVDSLPAHVERGYAAPIPATLFFYCDRPAAADGETTLFDGFDIFEHLNAQTQQYFAENKLRYRLRIGPDLWQRTLMTDDHAEALYLIDEQMSDALDPERGERASCKVDGDVLIMDFVTPATRKAGRRSGLAFANSSLTYLYTYGMPAEGLLAHGNMELRTEDDQPFPMALLHEAFRASQAAEYKIKWGKGDMVFVDNHTVLHGRATFTDLDRNIFVRIGFGA